MKKSLKVVRKMLYILGIGSFFLLQNGYPIQQQSLHVLIAVPDPFSTVVEQDFRNNLPDALLAEGQFISPSGGVESTLAAAAELRRTQFDLVVLPLSFASDPSFPNELLPLVRDLTDQRLALIDAGLVYVAFKSYLVFETRVIGAELPWNSSFLIAITADTNRFEEAFAFLKAIAQNILNFQIDGGPVSVKAHNLPNNTGEMVYDVHLIYDRPPEDADAEDNRDWECHVEGNEAICTTDIGLAPEKRLAVGVAFRSEEPGILNDCWWSKENGAEAGGC